MSDSEKVQMLQECLAAVKVNLETAIKKSNQGCLKPTIDYINQIQKKTA